MQSAVQHYDRRYVDTVFEPLLDDTDFYHVKAECAARTYFGSFARPLGSVLEYGCGIGNNIAAIPNSVGYDVNPDAVAECRRRGVEATYSRSEIPDRHFRYVLCRHVLEHVEQPMALLASLFDCLCDGGLLILVVPKEFHANASFQPDVNRHLYNWNFRTLNNLVWQAGGDVVENRYEAMFGIRTYRLLRPLLSYGGIPTYHRCVRWFSWLVSDKELVIHARPRRNFEVTI